MGVRWTGRFEARYPRGMIVGVWSCVDTGGSSWPATVSGYPGRCACSALEDKTAHVVELGQSLGEDTAAQRFVSLWDFEILSGAVSTFHYGYETCLRTLTGALAQGDNGGEIGQDSWVGLGRGIYKQSGSQRGSSFMVSYAPAVSHVSTLAAVLLRRRADICPDC